MKTIRRYFLCFGLILMFTTACVPNEPDILGDILIRFDPPPTAFPNTFTDFEIGIFPSEVLISHAYTANLAIKTAILDEGQAIITNILPGTYVVALVSTPTVIPPRRVVQVVSDEVTLVELDLNTLNDQ